MKQLILIISLAFLSNLSLAQECDCESTFNWVKKTFEENDAGFEYIVKKKGKESYTIHNQMYGGKVKNVKQPLDCQTLIRGWLAYFRKAHVEFHYTKANKSASGPKLKKPVGDSTHQLHNKFLTSKIPFIEQLNKNTLYLRIPSFQGSQKQLIDSIVFVNQQKILNTENLIIDIRNGTGGSDAAYENLLPILYTNPIRMPTVEFLSTPLNNKRMYELATNTGIALQYGLNSTEEQKHEFMAQYDTLSKHIGEFVNLNSSDITITELDTIYSLPKNIGIMVNHNNVSTDEQFLLEARQSKKVKLFGTTTKGGLDVSNLNLTFSPCENYVLVYALSRSLRIPDMAIDDVGIMPDYYIDKEIPNNKWIYHVSNILNKKSQ